ncbi:MAG TPA: LacI family DNA-binding transcriptional regulator [Acidobacteriaceae bacterium]|nr:LacI family DNA-binding transcriptional regulator [Acidobacteriaceae bacterium]
MTASEKGQKARRPGAPASLATLSEHLGLSVAAISRVLNRAPAAKSIPKATQDRIFAAAAALNYRPNVLARGLRRGRSMTVGVLVPEVSEGYATLVLTGIEQGLLQAGYFYFLISHHHRDELIDRSQTMLVDRSVDGMIAVDTSLRQHPHLPTITVSCPDEHEGVTNIVLNHKRAAELAIDHLMGLGHREVAVIKGQSFSSDTESRWQAIRYAAARASLALDPKLTAQLEGDAPGHETGYFATQRLLASSARFTALFAFNDVSAIGAVRALREAGLRVPQDVSVVGFDDVQSAAFQNPGLTTVRQPLRTMGMLAAEAVVRRITAPEDHPPAKQIVVDPELVVRESTCPPPAKRPARSL